MSLTVLSVAYPFAAVGPDAVGGAEQVLTRLDEALVEHGHRSVVIAAEGSSVRGTLVASPRVPGEISGGARNAAPAFHRRAIEKAIDRYAVDVLHFHGLDFPDYLPVGGPPALATLHMPPSWYPLSVFALERPATFLNPVSASQRLRCPPSANLLPPVANGVPVARYGARCRRRSFALALGRICPEKGFDIALEAGARSGIPVFLGGRVFGYADHRTYFEREIVPRLVGGNRYLGELAFERKRRFLAAARCVLVTSLVDETSSLTAMEALASGTPVVALRRGALPEIVEEGRTGFLVDAPEQIPEAMRACGSIDSEECRRAARERFDASRMVREYLAIYRALAGGGRMETEAVSSSAEPRARGI